jgi:hypothetical protein
MKYLAIVGFVGASAASCILANSAANAGVLLRDVFVRPWCPNCADGEHSVPSDLDSWLTYSERPIGVQMRSAAPPTPQARRVPAPAPVAQATPQARRVPAPAPVVQATPQARRVPASVQATPQARRVPAPVQATP